MKDVTKIEIGIRSQPLHEAIARSLFLWHGGDPECWDSDEKPWEDKLMRTEYKEGADFVTEVMIQFRLQFVDYHEDGWITKMDKVRWPRNHKEKDEQKD